MSNLLKEYSKELELYEEMSIDDLIRSHRHLRSLNLEDNKIRLKNLEECRVKAKEIALEEARNEYIHLKALRSMTLDQIIRMLCDE